MDLLANPVFQLVSEVQTVLRGEMSRISSFLPLGYTENARFPSDESVRICSRSGDVKIRKQKIWSRMFVFTTSNRSM